MTPGETALAIAVCALAGVVVEPDQRRRLALADAAHRRVRRALKAHEERAAAEAAVYTAIAKLGAAS